jgi:ribonuclease P protein component, eubacterial
MKKTVSIKKNYEFTRLFKKGSFYVGKFMVVYVLNNRKNTERLGISLSSKFGNSVKRNREKRLIRENYRLLEDYLKDGKDIVISARQTEKLPEFSEIKREMKYLFRKLDLFDQEKMNNID